MAFNISYRFQVLNKFSKPLRKMRKQLNQTRQKVRNLSQTMKSTGISIALQKIANKTVLAARSMRKFAVATGRAMADAARKVRKFAADSGRRLRDVGQNLTTRLSVPLAILGGFALKASAKTETMTIAFESMLGSLGKAKDLVKDVRDFTSKTPFQFGDVGGATKQLLAFGVAGKNVLSKLKFLGDIAAGAGVPLSDMAQIFGKVKAKGKAMTEEILQASDRGVPIIAQLAKVMKRPERSILKLASKGKISAKIFEQALQFMTEKGGVFFDQMKKQSNTLAGIFSTVVDNVENILSDVGDELVKTFSLKQAMKDFIGFLQSAGEKFKAFAKANPQLTKMIFAFTAIAAVMGPLLFALGLVASGLAVLLSPIALIAAAVVGFGVGLAVLAAKSQGVRDAFSRLGKALEPVVNGFKAMWAAIRDVLELSEDLSFDDFAKVAESAIDTVTAGVKFLINQVKILIPKTKGIRDAFSRLGTALGPVVDGFKFIASAIWDAIGSSEVFASSFEFFARIAIFHIDGVTSAVNFLVDMIKGAIALFNNFLTGVSRIQSFFEFNTPEVKTDPLKRGRGRSPTVGAAAAVERQRGLRSSVNVDGDITVRATPGTQVQRTQSRLRGRGNLSLNIAGAAAGAQ